MCFPHSVSPRTNARCQVHSRRLIHVCWTKPHTQSQGRACPRKRGGETARKGHCTPARRTRARGYVCPGEARDSTPERTRAAGMTRPQLTHSGVCSLPRVPTLSTEQQADSRGRNSDDLAPESNECSLPKCGKLRHNTPCLWICLPSNQRHCSGSNHYLRSGA